MGWGFVELCALFYIDQVQCHENLVLDERMEASYTVEAMASSMIFGEVYSYLNDNPCLVSNIYVCVYRATFHTTKYYLITLT